MQFHSGHCPHYHIKSFFPTQFFSKTLVWDIWALDLAKFPNPDWANVRIWTFCLIPSVLILQAWDFGVPLRTLSRFFGQNLFPGSNVFPIPIVGPGLRQISQSGILFCFHCHQNSFFVLIPPFFILQAWASAIIMWTMSLVELQSPRLIEPKLKELGQISRSGHWPKLAQMSGSGHLPSPNVPIRITKFG